MSEQLGKMEKPSVEEFKTGRKLYFIPLVYSGKEASDGYLGKYNRYWEQVDSHTEELELKLGKVNKIYHEFVSVDGEDGVKAIAELNEKSCEIIKKRLEKGAQLEAIEQMELLTEFMDWTRCLALGLQNQNVLVQIYEFYVQASKKRNEHITQQVDETLKANEVGMFLMREGHQVQFPPDIQVFYVAPPALDELRRWFRDQESK
jgi:hypothetical protein